MESDKAPETAEALPALQNQVDPTGGAGYGTRTEAEGAASYPPAIHVSTDSLVLLAVIAAFAIGGLMVLFAPRRR